RTRTRLPSFASASFFVKDILPPRLSAAKIVALPMAPTGMLFLSLSAVLRASTGDRRGKKPQSYPLFWGIRQIWEIFFFPPPSPLFFSPPNHPPAHILLSHPVQGLPYPPLRVSLPI